MQMIKYIILLLIFLLTSMIGKLLSKKYYYRLEELEEIKNALNVFKSKIKFTYSTIPEIFKEIAEGSKSNIAKIFENTVHNIRIMPVTEAWNKAVDETKENTNLKEEDIKVIKGLSKQLGITDVEGQISQIDITQNFLDTQIRQAQEEKEKNQKLYQKLGTTIGIAIVILLV